MSDVTIFIKKTEKFIVNFDNRIHTYSYSSNLEDDLIDIIEELNMRKDNKIYLILDLNFFYINDISTNGYYINTNNYLHINDEDFEIIDKVLNEYKLNIYKIIPFTEIIRNNKKYENKVIVFEYLNSYIYFKYKDKENEILLKKEIEDYDIFLYGFEDYWNIILEIKVNNIKNVINFKNSLIRKLEYIFIAITLLVFISSASIYYFLNKNYFNTNKMKNENEILIGKIENIEEEIENAFLIDDEEKTEKLEEKSIKMSKKKIYEDIDFLINISEYINSYQLIEYQDNFWNVKLNIKNILSLEKIQDEIKKRYLFLELLDIFDKNGNIICILKYGNSL